MAIPAQFVDELIARCRLEEIAAQYVSLQYRGGRYWACCPFHNEKTPSFTLSPERQQFYCFGCHKGGGVITFVREIENLSYQEAVYFLARRAGMTVPEEASAVNAQRRRARILQLNRDAARFYHQLLLSPQGQSVRDYLSRRQITRRTAVKFGMGASADAWDVLLNAMVQQGYEKQELLDAGLIVRNQKGGFYDKFRNRLMLPVISTRGDVIAFGSRVTDNSQPKYMNSADTPVYSKRRTLYGLNFAKKTKRSNLILCEGNLDVVTLHQAGFDNAVATMGTALTGEQIGEIVRTGIPELIVCYDNDSAGQSATLKALSLLHHAALKVRVLQLPLRMVNGSGVKQDPDDFIKFQGSAAFERLLRECETAAAYRMNCIAAKYDLSTDDGRLSFSNEIREFLATFPANSAEREIYTARAAEMSRIPKDILSRETQKAENRSRNRRRRMEERRAVYAPQTTVLPLSMRYENPRSARAEEGIIRLLLYDSGLFTEAPPLDLFSSPELREICSMLWNACESGRRPALDMLAEKLDAGQMGHITAISEQPVMPQDARKALSDYIQVIREQAEMRSAQGDVLSAAVEAAKKKRNSTQGG